MLLIQKHFPIFAYFTKPYLSKFNFFFTDLYSFYTQHFQILSLTDKLNYCSESIFKFNDT